MTSHENAHRHAGTVLVTGACGGLGTAVTADLARAGYRVVGADRRGPADPDASAHLAAFVTGDLNDPAVVRAAFDAAAGQDGAAPAAVVHLAAIPAPGIVDEYETLRSNVMTAYTVFQEAGRRGAGRVVGASSAAAVGLAWADRDQSPQYVPVDEEHPDLTVDSYGLSKVMSESAAAFTTRRWHTTTVMLRFPFIGEGERLADRLAEVAADPAANRRELWGWVHTQDAAGAVRAALTAPLTGHHVINIAAPDSSCRVPTRELLAAHHPTAKLLDDGMCEHGSLFATDRSSALLGFTARQGWRTSGTTAAPPD